MIQVLNILLTTKMTMTLDRYVYIKYFESREKNISFMIEDESILVKYNEIWNKI